MMTLHGEICGGAAGADHCPNLQHDIVQINVEGDHRAVEAGPSGSQYSQDTISEDLNPPHSLNGVPGQFGTKPDVRTGLDHGANNTSVGRSKGSSSMNATFEGASNLLPARFHPTLLTASTEHPRDLRSPLRDTVRSLAFVLVDTVCSLNGACFLSYLLHSRGTRASGCLLPCAVAIAKEAGPASLCSAMLGLHAPGASNPGKESSGDRCVSRYEGSRACLPHMRGVVPGLKATIRCMQASSGASRISRLVESLTSRRHNKIFAASEPAWASRTQRNTLHTW